MPRNVNNAYAVIWALAALATLTLGSEPPSQFALAKESSKESATNSEKESVVLNDESANGVQGPKNVDKKTRFRVQLVSSLSAEKMLTDGGVFIFFDPSCPICAEYFPSIENLASRFPKRTFRLIMRSSEFDLAAKFAAEYKPKCELVVDEESQLKKKLSARVTPQSFLVEPGGAVIYSGRIDDRYKALGQRRSVIGSKDLEAALMESTKQMKITNAVTDPVGCFLE